MIMRCRARRTFELTCMQIIRYDWEGSDTNKLLKSVRDLVPLSRCKVIPTLKKEVEELSSFGKMDISQI
jgi:hypothetical protein